MGFGRLLKRKAARRGGTQRAAGERVEQLPRRRPRVRAPAPAVHVGEIDADGGLPDADLAAARRSVS